MTEERRNESSVGERRDRPERSASGVEERSGLFLRTTMLSYSSYEVLLRILRVVSVSYPKGI
jgi:hypothetical protein